MDEPAAGTTAAEPAELAELVEAVISQSGLQFGLEKLKCPQYADSLKTSLVAFILETTPAFAPSALALSAQCSPIWNCKILSFLIGIQYSVVV